MLTEPCHEQNPSLVSLELLPCPGDRPHAAATAEEKGRQAGREQPGGWSVGHPEHVLHRGPQSHVAVLGRGS